MPRPPKCRRVEQYPGFTCFKPAGVPMPELAVVQLTIEEIEAVRLRDLEALEHEDCAARMSVSRPTFHRILASARQKIADAMVNGKAVRIEGGHYELATRKLKCIQCGHFWESTVCCRRTRCPKCHEINWEIIK
ncbi:MAG: DUF134 domain-containing protein [Firmicutes bacterium]|nr:DUF134 domain-containing protein [Bacillota bacterium]